MIKIAFPKGRLGESVAEKFMEAGYTFEGAFDETRKLYFENEKMGVSMFWVKPFDVPVYVERGAADLGVCGNDVLLERDLHVYEIADLKRGVCRLSSACKKENASERRCQSGTLRVATKYPNISRKYYGKKGVEIDIIELNGSIEIAPVIGLSDVIVDIVESGASIRENGLKEIEVICEVSARLTANIAMYQTRMQEISEILKRLK